MIRTAIIEPGKPVVYSAFDPLQQRTCATPYSALPRCTDATPKTRVEPAAASLLTPSAGGGVFGGGR